MAAVGIKVTLLKVSIISFALTNWFGNSDTSPLLNKALIRMVPVARSIKLSIVKKVPAASFCV